jgi:hypothetical protein
MTSTSVGDSPAVASASPTARAPSAVPTSIQMSFAAPKPVSPA